MIRQIEEKVVNRLRQVTSAIQQDGANQVSIIRSTAEREAAVEFARATALRAEIVGKALAEDPAPTRGGRRRCSRCSRRSACSRATRALTLLPAGGAALGALLASSSGEAATPGRTTGTR